MGLGGSGLRTSYMGKSNLSCLECKKITTLEPVYLVYWKDPDKNGYNTSDKRAEIMYSLNENHRSYDKLCTCASCNAEIMIKIEAKLTFCIQDIVGYERKHEESGIIYYEIIPYFFNNTNKVKMYDIRPITVPDHYLEKMKTLEYLDINNVFFRDHFFHRHKSERNDILYKFNYDKRITNKERLDFITTKYKDNYLVEDIV